MANYDGGSLLLRNVTPQDTEQLRPLLQSWIRDSETGLVIDEEVEETLRSMSAVGEGDPSRIYEIAEGAGGVILGVMGLTDASKTLEIASPSVAKGSAAELISAFVNPNVRGHGVGKALVKDLEYTARSLLYDEILVTSGPRYRVTGWPFWQSLYGEPVTIVRDAYGPGADAPVWRKTLVK